MLRGLSKGAGQFIQRVDFLPVHFIDNSATIRCQISIDRVRQYVRQNDDVRMSQVNLVLNKVFEEMAKPQISWPISFK